jgi:hypothetical protein
MSDDTSAVAHTDFYAYMPTHSYICAPSGEMWPAASVNARLASVRDGDKLIQASTWLDQFQSVEQMTWAPGDPQIITGKLISHGGWIQRPGWSCFNLYRPPTLTLGDAAKATQWIEHVHAIFPLEAPHIISWLAHRVQRPGEKINHALLLGGQQGVGKDTILEPVKAAVGPWNVSEVAPTHLLGRFNGYIKSVILRVSEARDLGDIDRFSFYEHMKTLTAAPPDVLRCDEKHLRETSVLNACGVVITSNHKTDGIYLPADDRRHFVAWSELTRDDFDADYWTTLYQWFQNGGNGHVAAFLAEYDLSGFDPKAPPPKTPAFHDIVDAGRAPEDAELADVLDLLGNPDATTLHDLSERATGSFADWLRDRKNRRQVPHRLETAGYTPVRNPSATDGLWKIGTRRQAVYGRSGMSIRDRIAAATFMTEMGR